MSILVSSVGLSTSSMTFPVASPSILPSSESTPEAVTPGLTQGARDAIYVSTIVGGTFLIALLLWVVYRRRIRRQTAQRQRVQEELNATTKPRKRLVPEKIEDPIWYGKKQAIPAGLAERFRRKDAYIKAALGEAYPMHTAEVDDQQPLQTPPRVLTKIDELDTSNTPVIFSPIPQRRSRLSDTALAQAHLRMASTEASPRWSWTNSQAPATPRLYVPTIASSRASATRFRMAVNWVKTKGERITSGEAVGGDRMILPGPGVLKNQASKPNLAPKKLVKKNSTRRSCMSFELDKAYPSDL